MENKWLLLLYSLPLQAGKERVSIWRKLRRLGSVALKNSVYVLPCTEALYENFQWLTQEIQSLGGEATLIKVEGIENVSHKEIVELFNKERDADFKEIIEETRGIIGRLKGLQGDLREEETIGKELTRVSQRLKFVKDVDFFGAPLAKEAEALVLRCQNRLKTLQGLNRGPSPRKHPLLDRKDFIKKKWVTRPRPHVDRLASAWLIKRFIDPQAKIIFSSEKEMVEGAIPFDILGTELSHRGEDCTFETLIKFFGIKDKTAWEMAKIVHEVDLKDGKYGRQEAKGVDLFLRGLLRRYKDDQVLLEAGLDYFETLYHALKRG